ncbi:MAG: hypothetical protein M9894_03345 [Planctomycetes bacterium]|nr:hypothetical protein [Planctomycetota bacterium]
MARSFECPACAQPVTTSAAPGQTTTCRRCGAEARVPLRAVAHARREVTCEACGATQETTTSPGKRTRCRECQAEVRVPLRDPAAAEDDVPEEPAAPARRRRVEARQTCPRCGARADVADEVCPGCGEGFRSPVGFLPDPGRLGGGLLMLLGGAGAALGVGGGLAIGVALVGLLALLSGGSRRRR